VGLAAIQNLNNGLSVAWLNSCKHHRLDPQSVSGQPIRLTIGKV
jgi:hypothetical protein